MKTFKSFLNEAGPNAKPKAKGEADFVAAHKVEITDIEDQEKEGSAKVVTKDGSGKRKADRLDNKQAMGEDLSSTIFSVIRKRLEETAAASTVGGLKAGEGKIKQGSSDQSVGHSTQDPASTIGGRKGSEGKIKQGSSDENTPDTGKGEAINTIGGHKNREVKAMKQGSTDEKLPDQGGLGSREKEKNVPQGSSKEKTPDTGLSGAINTIGGHRNREATAMLQGSSKEKLPEEVELDELSSELLSKAGQKADFTGQDLQKQGQGVKAAAYQRQAQNLYKGSYKRDQKRQKAELSSGKKKYVEGFAEASKKEVEIDEAEKKLFPGTPEYKAKFGTDKEKHELKYGKSDVKKVTPYGYRDRDDNKKVKEAKTYRKMMKEADFTKKQTTMAHTIGKEFEKKSVGDKDKGGPYAVASAMVRDKPEAAKKAYATIKSKMKEEADAELLFKLYDDLNEENQEFFMQQLEEDAEALLLFAQNLMED
jgi:hypothetical protein